MPVKRRRPKHRTTEAAEVEEWSTLFETGFDFFDDLGFGHGSDATPAAREAAREAWQRLGRAYLALDRHNPAVPVPWAIETFGEPPCR